MIRSENAFETIYRDNFRKVYAFLLKMCRDSELAEELTQETFYQAYRSLSRYKGQCQMYTWLAAIAKNVFFKYLRKAKRAELEVSLYVADPTAPLNDEPGYNLQRQLDISQVRGVIRELPEKYQDVLILRLYAELSYEEIAQKLGISVNSAKVIYFRAKNIIKEALLHE